MLTFDRETHTYRLDGETVPSVTEIVGRVSAGFNVSDSVLTYAARRGTAVHEYCELMDYGALDPMEVEPELAGYVRAYRDFLRDYRPKWEYIEKPLASPALRYAGTLDRLGVIDGYQTILDIKTALNPGRKGKIKLACQLAGYDDLCMEALGIIAPRCLGLYLKPDGRYTVVKRSGIEERYQFNAAAMFTFLLGITKIAEGYR